MGLNENFIDSLRKLLFKNKIYRQHQKAKAHGVVPFEAFGFKEKHRENYKNNQSNHFLNDFELHQIERAAVAFVSNFVGRNLKEIFKQGQSPTD